MGQVLNLPLQLLDPELGLGGIVRVARSTCWTVIFFDCSDILHSRGGSDKSGGRERGGRSRHDNMGMLPRVCFLSGV
jgi:hypothetical protein